MPLAAVGSAPAAICAQIERFRYARAGRDALADVSFAARPGEFVVVTGASGAGKTTFLNCLAGCVPRYFPGDYVGRVLVRGRDVGAEPLAGLAPVVGLLLRRPESQLIALTVEEDVAFGPENLGFDRDEIRRRVSTALAAVELTGFERRRTSTLSGGEARRAALAGLLAIDPPVLLLDRALAELDPAGRRSVAALLARLCREAGRTVVLVDDRVAELAPFASRVIELQSGRLVADETCATWRARYADPEPGRIRTTGACQPANPPGEPIVELRDVSYRYPRADAWALQGVGLTVRAGELVALVGANGAGKTTLARHLIGLLRATWGTVRICGRDVARVPTHVLSDDVGYLFQDPDLQIFGDSVLAEVSYALRLRRLPDAEVARRAAAELAAVGLAGLRDEHPYALSRGERQRLALASVLIHRPRLLVVDEPTAGLDPAGALNLLDLLDSHRAEGGAVILITHDVALAAARADRLVELAAGRITNVVDLNPR
jgi:energy-coupling factor transport system ATP-binding protein